MLTLIKLLKLLIQIHQPITELYLKMQISVSLIFQKVIIIINNKSQIYQNII